MNRQKIESILSRHSVKTFPMNVTVELHPETPDGITRISAALTTPDVNGGGVKVFTGIKAGGFCPWLAQHVVLNSDEENDVLATVKAATLLALGHEYDEHALYDGKRIIEPHPAI